jgi:hypothetical protein
VVSKPSADSFAVGRRQKALKSFLDSLTICDKVASGNKRRPRCACPGLPDAQLNLRLGGIYKYMRTLEGRAFRG